MNRRKQGTVVVPGVWCSKGGVQGKAKCDVVKFFRFPITRQCQSKSRVLCCTTRRLPFAIHFLSFLSTLFLHWSSLSFTGISQQFATVLQFIPSPDPSSSPFFSMPPNRRFHLSFPTVSFLLRSSSLSLVSLSWLFVSSAYFHWDKKNDLASASILIGFRPNPPTSIEVPFLRSSNN